MYRRFISFVSLLSLVAVGLATSFSFAPARAAEPSAPVLLELPAQPLGDALAALAARTGLLVGVDASLVAGKQAPALAGRLTPIEALEALLAGSGLVAARTDDGSYVLRPAPAAAAAMPAVREEVTVLGSRQMGAPLANVPVSISFVSEADIATEQATAGRIEDLLARRVPGFNPTNNGVRQIRGRTAQVFINGVPVNEQLRASSGADLTLVALDQLGGIEVSRGANSAYGFGSPGGIIALSTPRAESTTLTLRSVARLSFNPQHLGGSTQANLYQSAGRIVGDFDYQIGGSLRYDGLSHDPDGKRALGFASPLLISNSEEALYDLDASIGYSLGDAGSLRLTGTFGYADVLDAYDSDFLGVYRVRQSSLVRTPAGDDSYRRSHTLNFTYELPDLFGNSLRLEAFTSYTYTEALSAFEVDRFRDEQTNEYYGLRSAITTPLDLLYPGATLTYGFDALRNEYYRPFYDDRSGALLTVFAPDVTFDTYAPHAQLEFALGALQISGGVRHERYTGHVETAGFVGGIVGGDVEDFSLTLYNAGAIYALNDALDVYVSYSQGAEITQLGRDARDAATAAQVDPQPAKSNQYELGLRGAWPTLEAAVALFYTESDLLSALSCDGFNPCTPLREPREFWGVEASFEWRIDERWTTGGTLTWQDGIRKLENGDTRRIGSRDVTPVLAAPYLQFEPRRGWRNRLQLDYRGSRAPFGTSVEFGEGNVDSVLLANLAAELDVGPGTLQLGVRNLLNEHYFATPSAADNTGFYWIPEEGTRISLSYSMRW